MAESRLSVLPPIKPKNLGDAYQFSKKEALRSNGALMQVRRNMTQSERLKLNIACQS